MSPELAAVLTSALITTIGLYVTFAKWLPTVMERREKLFEQQQESRLADEQSRREEDAQQRLAENEYRQAQIKVSDAQLALLTQLIDTNAKNAASYESTSKELITISAASRATEKALTENTVELSMNTETVKEFTHSFLNAFNQGSEPVRSMHSAIENFQLNGIKPDEAARQQLTRIETAVNEINDKVLPCTETKTIMENEMVLVLSEARRLIELFNRDAQLKIEDKRKSDSKPIPAITVDPSDKQEGAAA